MWFLPQQTVTQIDTFITDVRDGNLLDSVTFELFDEDGELHQHRGVYGLTDGGYHRWLSMMAPFPALDDEGALWSKWVESLRKDVEDCFGILKGLCL